MNIKDREILLRDLAGRITHSVKVEVTEDELELGTQSLDAYWLDRVGNEFYDIKPHLFSIKDALRNKAFVEEFRELFPDSDATELEGPGGRFDCGGSVPLEDIDLLTDLLGRHNVDWRGLIKKGLAVDAAKSHVYEEITE